LVFKSARHDFSHRLATIKQKEWQTFGALIENTVKSRTRRFEHMSDKSVALAWWRELRAPGLNPLQETLSDPIPE